jgi:hypothetical protein
MPEVGLQTEKNIDGRQLMNYWLLIASIISVIAGLAGTCWLWTRADLHHQSNIGPFFFVLAMFAQGTQFIITVALWLLLLQKGS